MIFQTPVPVVFAVPAGSGDYAPERITITSPESLYGITVMIAAAPAAAVFELWLLKAGGAPATDADFALYKNSTGGETWPLAGWHGAQIRVKSGGNAGNATLSVTAV